MTKGLHTFRDLVFLATGVYLCRVMCEWKDGQLELLHVYDYCDHDILPVLSDAQKRELLRHAKDGDYPAELDQQAYQAARSVA